MNVRSMALVCAAFAFAAPLFAAEHVRHESRATVPARQVLRVEVRVPVGEVELRTAETDTIEAVATFSRDRDEGQDPAREQSIVDASEITIEVSGSRAVVKPKYGSAADTWYGRHHPSDLKLTVTMPARRHIEMNQRVGDVTLNGWFGNVDVELSVGEITVNVAKKSVRQLSASTTIGEVTTSIGDRTVTKEGVLAGHTDYLNESGESTMNLRTRVGEIRVTLQ